MKKKEKCSRETRQSIPGLLSSQYCSRDAVWRDLCYGVYYCEHCPNFVHHGELERIDGKKPVTRYVSQTIRIPITEWI